jgi:predicted transcriptional regulator
MLVERISGLPVVDDSDKIVGIITVADVLRGHGVPAHYPVQQSWQRLGSIFRRLNHYADRGEPDDSVDEHMIREVVCVSPGHDIQTVLNLMKCHLVKRLIVCDEEHHVAGIVTRSDLMRIFFGITDRESVSPSSLGEG